MIQTNKCKSSNFVKWLQEKESTKCGYIMGASGQNPRDCSINSWFFTQYKDRDNYTAAQEAKALYWREHAPFIFDCAGLAEGYVSQTLKLPLSEINTKARYIYSDWCRNANGTSMAKMPRVPGTAVFKFSKSPSDIHHIGYLEKPVIAGKPQGDWYIIEAKGVLYGVVRTRLNADSKWNAWGQMVKYFDYGNVQPEPEPQNDTIIITGNSVNVRVGPGVQYESVTIAHKGDIYPIANNSVLWYPIQVSNDVLWVSSKYSKKVGD